jgi:penicillin-binding protein-related factor A (putative recombinase)
VPLANFKNPSAKEVSSAKRGKVSEVKVREYLKTLESEHANFTFNRIGDAGAARGAFAAQAGDFQVFGWGKNWLIEVKETQHAYRLPHGNLGPEQVGKMRKRELAGSIPVVLVHHRSEKIWRCPCFSTFLHREGGSWDLRGVTAQSLPEILNNIFNFN